jgi:hypothetical protein
MLRRAGKGWGGQDGAFRTVSAGQKEDKEGRSIAKAGG